MKSFRSGPVRLRSLDGIPTNSRRLRVEWLEDRRLLSYGELEWVVQFGTEDELPESTYAQAVDANGYIYVAGSTSGSLSGQQSLWRKMPS